MSDAEKLARELEDTAKKWLDMRYVDGMDASLLCGQAAYTIVSLREENERLREKADAYDRFLLTSAAMRVDRSSTEGT